MLSSQSLDAGNGICFLSDALGARGFDETHMPRWSSIVYRELDDVPRRVVARDESGTYFFWSRFVEAHDDYRDFYDVYRMPLLLDQELRGSWVGLENRAIEHLGAIPTHSLSFDSERPAVDLDVLDKIKGKT